MSDDQNQTFHVNGANSTRTLLQIVSLVECITEEELALLCDVKPSTCEAWRKRANGPRHIIAGNRVLYRVEVVRRWLETKVHRDYTAGVGPDGRITL
jgi:hypothetical protein